MALKAGAAAAGRALATGESPFGGDVEAGGAELANAAETIFKEILPHLVKQLEKKVQKAEGMNKCDPHEDETSGDQVPKTTTGEEEAECGSIKSDDEGHVCCVYVPLLPGKGDKDTAPNNHIPIHESIFFLLLEYENLNENGSTKTSKTEDDSGDPPAPLNITGDVVQVRLGHIVFAVFFYFDKFFPEILEKIEKGMLSALDVLGDFADNAVEKTAEMAAAAQDTASAGAVEASKSSSSFIDATEKKDEEKQGEKKDEEEQGDPPGAVDEHNDNPTSNIVEASTSTSPDILDESHSFDELLVNLGKLVRPWLRMKGALAAQLFHEEYKLRRARLLEA
eukprot:g340.t1